MSWTGVTETVRCEQRYGEGVVESMGVMEKPSQNASRKLRGVQRHGKAKRKAILVECHGIVVTECVTEDISDHRM